MNNTLELKIKTPTLLEVLSSKYNKMTVCIGALANDGDSVIVASDKMITFPMGGFTYQSDNAAFSKIYNIGETTKLMVSGLTVSGDEIFKKIAKESYTNSVEDIVEEICTIYQEYRQEIIRKLVLIPRSISNVEEYRGLLDRIPADTSKEIENQLANYQLGVDIIVVGKNKENKYSIYTIGNPGISFCFDVIGYTTIGAGALPSMYKILDLGYTKSLSKEEVEEIVLKAKQAAEVVPGVGTQTDIQTLSIE